MDGLRTCRDKLVSYEQVEKLWQFNGIIDAIRLEQML